MSISKVLLDIAMLILFCIVCDYFSATGKVGKLSSDRKHT